MTTIIFGGREAEVSAGASADGDLWVEAADLPAASGWRLEPQGVCAGDVCVPVPEGGGWTRNSRFNLSALARHLGQPSAADPAQGVWVFADAPDQVPPARAGDEAPDFTLPDLDGKLHSLSDYRGHKVLLLSWASW